MILPKVTELGVRLQTGARIANGLETSTIRGEEQLLKFALESRDEQVVADSVRSMILVQKARVYESAHLSSLHKDGGNTQAPQICH